MTATVAGVKFSDQLAALLDHAESHGFRIEQDTRTKRPAGVLLYSPDPSVPPINVTEKGARLNRAHYDNIKRSIYRAGCPPLPQDIQREHEHDADDLSGPIFQATERGVFLDVSGGKFTETLASEEGPEFAARVVEGLVENADIGHAEAQLIATTVQIQMHWFRVHGTNRLEEMAANAAQQIYQEAESRYRGEVDEALRMAAEHEATAQRAMAQLERVEKSERQAREDCGDAIAKLRLAQERIKELEAVLTPLRALIREER